MKKHFRVFSFAIACALASIPAFAMDYSSRKFNNGVEANYPVGSVIVNADCVFEDGKFIMKSLPSNLPELFTIRFTAPEDFTQGNTIVINGTEMQLRVPSMINASSAIFRAGAVFHIDIDMDRQLAFAWGNQGGSGSGVLPDMSYDEQFAGYHYLDGKRVYVKTFEYPSLRSIPVTSGNDVRKIAHGIEGIDNCVEMRVSYSRPGWSSVFNSFYRNADYAIWTHFSSYDITFAGGNNYLDYKVIATLFYTCTDR